MRSLDCSCKPALYASESIRENFFQSQYFEAVLRQGGWKTVQLKVQKHGSEASILVFAPQNLRLYRTLFPCYRALYGPVVQGVKEGSDQEILEQLFDRLHSRLKTEGTVLLDVTAPFPFPENYEVFSRNGYIPDKEAKGECSVVIDLQSDIDVLWKNAKRFARRNIKKAIDDGVEVKGIENEMELGCFYSIYKDTCNRRGFQASPYRLIEAFWKQLEPRRISKFFLAWWRNMPIAGILNTFYGDESIPYIACSLDRFWKLHPNHLLFWHSIKWSKEVAKSSVFKLYHLPATREEKQGIDYFTFKTCFGGSLIEECSFYRKTFSPVRLRISQMLHGGILRTRAHVNGQKQG